MNANQQTNRQPLPGENLPWYRQFWPWFIIALPASVVIASFVTLWLAITHPDQLVVDDSEYLKLKSELKAQKLKTQKSEIQKLETQALETQKSETQAPAQTNKENETDKSVPHSN